MNFNYYGRKVIWYMMLQDQMKVNFDCELCYSSRCTIIPDFQLFQVYILDSRLYLYIYIYYVYSEYDI